MVAMPSTEMFYVAVPFFGFPKQFFLELSIRHEFNGCSFGVRSSGQKISNNNPVETILAVGLVIHVEIADVLPTLLALRVALQFIKNVILNAPVKDDLAIRRAMQE